MTLKYARIDAIIRKLAGRITVVNMNDYGITGITGTEIGTDLIELEGQSIEEFMDMYLGMIYILPLKNNHAYLSAVAEKLICAQVYLSYFPTQGESADNSDSYTSVLRTQALNDFQVLFDGLGIFVPGASNNSNSLQNDETKTQLSVKAVLLPNEEIKPFIGYDFDGDSIVDTDLFKMNTNVSPSFYSTGNFEKFEEWDSDIVDGIRVRERHRTVSPYKPEIDFF